ncbi:MAG TPA: ABC transporter permease [Herpetosiphonaceae bacterium]
MREIRPASADAPPRSEATWRRRRPARGRAGRIGLLLGSAPLLLVLLLPLAALILRVPLRDVLASVATREARQAIGLSLSTSLISVALAIVGGTPLALLLARGRFRGRTALDTLLDLPMVLPPSVAGIALLVAFGRRGLLGQQLQLLGIELPFTMAAVIVAQVFVAAPFYVKAAANGFAAVDRDLEAAAALDGAAPRQVFRFITAPLAWPALLGGAVMTWARALGEFGATIIFAGNFVGRTQTMPLAIYQGFEQDLTLALSLAVVLLGVSFAVLGVMKGLLRQR